MESPLPSETDLLALDEKACEVAEVYYTTSGYFFVSNNAKRARRRQIHLLPMVIRRDVWDVTPRQP